MFEDFSILIGGAAGQGSRKAGLIIGKFFSKIGYQVFIYNDYQSLIREGHSFSQIRVSKKQISACKSSKIDFLLCLDDKTFQVHKNDLKEQGLILYNSERVFLKSLKNGIGMKIKTIVEKEQGSPIMENIALISAFAKIIGLQWKVVEQVLKEELKRYQEINIRVARAGFEQAPKIFNKIRYPKQKQTNIITGNEAVALGATRAGLDLYIAYPMTPATSILHFFAEKKKELKVGVSQLENEISVINAAIGAAYAGSRTMVGTSGGGFALMAEAFSLAVETETPVLIVESQRMAPASGVPTYTAQSDLSFVLNCGHGDIVKFVVAPGDAEEAALWAGELLNLSWRFQTPSILLLDKEISESVFSFDKTVLRKIKPKKPLLWRGKGQYLRYRKTKSGISPLAFPGTKGVVVKADSYEHDEYGLTVEQKEAVKEMQEKRLRKFQSMKKQVERMEAVKVFGKKTAKTALVVWGSTKGPAKEAAQNLGIRMVQILVVEPFPEKQIKKALQGTEKIILAEANALGQMEKLLASVGIKVNKKLLKYDGRPFLVNEIEEGIKGYL